MVPRGAIAIVPAAGVGRRLGTNKTVAELLGKPLLKWTLEALSASDKIAAIYPVIKEDDREAVVAMSEGLDKVKNPIEGGAERQDSVRNALNWLKGNVEDKTIVLVHDGARPLITPEIISRCIDGLENFHGVIAAVPPKDTVKETDGRFMVANTLNRDCLQLVQTPQAFHYDTLIKSYEAAERDGYLATDDSALVEWAGGTVKVVMGSYENIKITTPEDIEIAEMFLKRRTA
jgi:2-C-methyl-D-erythritol 4-phosphate cytidylyltransferase